MQPIYKHYPTGFHHHIPSPWNVRVAKEDVGARIITSNIIIARLAPVHFSILICVADISSDALVVKMLESAGGLSSKGYLAILTH